MPLGVSIHIGLNKVDPGHYGTAGELPFCVNDACEMLKTVALSEGFRPVARLLNEMATSVNVNTELEKAAGKLMAGDILLMTYSGHGGYFPDLNGDEADRYDETWILYDRMFIDDELYNALAKFREGVRIVIVSDSCHSGTVAKPLLSLRGDRDLDLAKSSSVQEKLKEEALFLYERHKEFYDPRIKHLPKPGDAEVKASVILLAGCNDNQLAYSQARSGRELSLFTDELITVYKSLQPGDTYLKFLEQIKLRIPERLRQTPNYYTVGKPSKPFENQRPFSI